MAGMEYKDSNISIILSEAEKGKLDRQLKGLKDWQYKRKLADYAKELAEKISKVSGQSVLDKF
jgi:hypothetical protein